MDEPSGQCSSVDGGRGWRGGGEIRELLNSCGCVSLAVAALKTMMKPLRIYVDTSVVGGCCDEEFVEESRALFQKVREGKVIILVSDLLIAELELAPPEVQEEFASLPPENLEAVVYSEESEQLRDAYLASNVVGSLHQNDAHHVAMATVA